MLSPGDQIDSWIVVSALGEGAMGSVYRCRHTLMNDIEAAIKVLKPHGQVGGRERFLREIRALHTLKHPSVVRVIGFGEDTERQLIWLAMDFVEGMDLQERIQIGPTPEHEAIHWFAAMAAGLTHAHSTGIFHRDIKPANIVVNEAGQAQLVDFGIAGLEGATKLTATGLVAGTPQYMAPEIFGGDDPDPAAADIYAFGQVFYEVLTGTIAFPEPDHLSGGQRLMHLIGAKAKQQHLDPGDGFSEPIRALIRQTTALAMKDRIPDMSVLQLALSIRCESSPGPSPLRSSVDAPAPSPPPAAAPTDDPETRWERGPISSEPAEEPDAPETRWERGPIPPAPDEESTPSPPARLEADDSALLEEDQAPTDPGVRPRERAAPTPRWPWMLAIGLGIAVPLGVFALCAGVAWVSSMMAGNSDASGSYPPPASPESRGTAPEGLGKATETIWDNPQNYLQVCQGGPQRHSAETWTVVRAISEALGGDWHSPETHCERTWQILKTAPALRLFFFAPGTAKHTPHTHLSFEALRGLNQLQTLTLVTASVQGELIRDPSPLSNLSRLTALHLHRIRFQDWASLGSFRQLTELSIRYSTLRNVQPLSRMPLRTVNLQHNRIVDITPLKSLNLSNPHRLGQALEGNPIPDHQLGWYTQFNNRCFNIDGRPTEGMFDDGSICFHAQGVSFIQGNVYSIDTRIDGSGTKRKLVVTQVDTRVKLDPGWRIGEVYANFYINPFVHTLQSGDRTLMEAPVHWGEDEGGP